MPPIQTPNPHGHCQISLWPLSSTLPPRVISAHCLFFLYSNVAGFWLLLHHSAETVVIEVPNDILNHHGPGCSSVPIFEWHAGRLTIWISLHPASCYTLVSWLFLSLSELWFPISEMGSVFSDFKNGVLVALTSPQSKCKCWVSPSHYFLNFRHLSNPLLDSSTWHPKHILSQSEFPVVVMSFLFSILSFTW